jgi:hypothetical protein
MISFNPIGAGAQTNIITAAADSDIIEQHFHGWERWYSKLASPAGGRVAEFALTPFQIDSGNNAWGNSILVLDVNDTTIPAHVGVVTLTNYDCHRIAVVDTERTTLYRIRFWWGPTADYAAIIARGDYTEIVFKSGSAAFRSSPVDMRMPRHPIGTLLHAQCWNADNTGTLDFLLGVHGYVGV